MIVIVNRFHAKEVKKINEKEQDNLHLESGVESSEFQGKIDFPLTNDDMDPESKTNPII